MVLRSNPPHVFSIEVRSFHPLARWRCGFRDILARPNSTANALGTLAPIIELSNDFFDRSGCCLVRRNHRKDDTNSTNLSSRMLWKRVAEFDLKLLPFVVGKSGKCTGCFCVLDNPFSITLCTGHEFQLPRTPGYA